MRMIVMGPMSGYRSYPVVMRGLVRAFEHHGIEVVCADVTGLYSHLQSSDVRELSLGRNPGLDVDVLFAMKPSSQMVKMGLPVVGLHVGDVSEIPEDWKLAIRAESLTVAPSTWMEEVIRSEVGEDCPEVVVANHGIEPEYLNGPVGMTLPPAFSFLHFCSAGVYPERKGTPQVLSAFQSLAMENRKVSLTLVVSEKRRPIKKLLGSLDPRVRDRVHVRINPSGFSPQAMIRLYRQHHVLLAPSRAEGFGIQPLEARALGIPVIKTRATGFMDHDDNDGVHVVSTGPFEPAWGGMGQAPSLDPADVYEAMKTVMETYDDLAEAAREAASSMSRWSWESTTEGLANRLKEGTWTR